MKRLLIVSPYPLEPANDGGRVRIRALARHLASRYDVHVAAPLSARPPAGEPLTMHAMPARGGSQLADPRTPLNLARIFAKLRPDAVMLEYIWLGAYVAPLAMAFGVPLLFDAFDVATTRLQRARSRIWPAVSLYERALLRVASRVFATSEVDRHALLRLGAPPERTFVVPNGVEMRDFCLCDATATRERVRRDLGVADAEKLLFFFGQLGYPPNVDALDNLTRHIMPRLDRNTRLVVAGRGATAALCARHASDRVSFIGPVESIAPFLHAADVVPVPVTHGSGTRLKILESVAAGVPTVTTAVGGEGIDTQACAPLLSIRDGWPAFATAVAEYAELPHQPPPLRFGAAYDWRNIAARITI